MLEVVIKHKTMPENFERPFQPQPPEGSNENDPSASKGDDQSPEIKGSPKQQLFMAACNERLDELVKLGMLPERFAEERRQNAALIEEGLSDNPEEDGTQFAEIGVESIGAFGRGVDQFEGYVDKHIDPYIESAHTLLVELEESQQNEKAAALRESLETVQGHLDEFREMMRRAKGLEVPFKDLHQRILEIEQSLKETQE